MWTPKIYHANEKSKIEVRKALINGKKYLIHISSLPSIESKLLDIV